MNMSGLADSKEESTSVDVSDEDLERASGDFHGNVPTLVGTYCFTCPTGQEIVS